MNAISFGPFMLSFDRFAFILGAGVFLVLASVIARRRAQSEGLENTAFWLLVTGAIAARLGHVLGHLDVYLASPLTIFAFWQGGFDARAGFAAAAIFVAIVAWRRRGALSVPLAQSAIAGLVVWQSVLFAMPDIDAALPATRFAALDGPPQHLAETAGQPVVVNLWATWCPPCRRELPMMIELAEEMPDIRVIFLNQGEFGPDVQRYLAGENLANDRVLLDPNHEALAHFSAPGLPATLFFAADGSLQHAHMGEISRAAFRDNLQSLR